MKSKTRECDVVRPDKRELVETRHISVETEMCHSTATLQFAPGEHLELSKKKSEYKQQPQTSFQVHGKPLKNCIFFYQDIQE